MTLRLLISVTASIFALSFAFTSTAKDAASPISLLLKAKGKTPSSLQQKKVAQTEHEVDEIDIDFKADKARYAEIEKVLIENYGPATSKRRNLRIWELPNTTKANGQSKLITIMAGEESGRYFVRLDRRGPTRGNNPRLNKTIKNRSATSVSQTKAAKSQKLRPYERD